MPTMSDSEGTLVGSIPAWSSWTQMVVLGEDRRGGSNCRASPCESQGLRRQGNLGKDMVRQVHIERVAVLIVEQAGRVEPRRQIVELESDHAEGVCIEVSPEHPALNQEGGL